MLGACRCALSEYRAVAGCFVDVVVQDIVFFPVLDFYDLDIVIEMNLFFDGLDLVFFLGRVSVFLAVVLIVPLAVHHFGGEVNSSAFSSVRREK